MPPTARLPGPLCRSTSASDLEDGTLRRMLSPLPVATGTGHGSGVASWDSGRKLLEAAKRTTPLLPGEMREQFAALFEPESLAITAAVLAAWGAAHFFGVGEAIDLLLLVVGAFTLGMAVFGVARDLADYVSIAADAKTEADLDRAAGHLARVVATIGVTVFVALIMKAGSKLKGRAGGGGRPTPPAAPEPPPKPVARPVAPPEALPETPARPSPLAENPPKTTLAINPPVTVPGGGLAAHEAAGGHTLAKHVGKTDAELAARLTAEPRISGSSSFTSQAVAESAIGETLNANQATINTWLSGSSPRLVVNHTLPSPVGRSLSRGTAGPVDASSVRAVLQRDPSLTTGYRIVTGFPQ